VFSPEFLEAVDWPPVQEKRPDQIWAFASFEAPTQSGSNEAIAVMARTADIIGCHDPQSQFAYAYPVPVARQWNDGLALRSQARNETSSDFIFLLAAISNCRDDRTGRLALVERTAARVRAIDTRLGNASVVKGACFGITPEEDRVARRADNLRLTTFALAFENCFYPGYATEKLIDAVSTGAVPVVLGGSRYSDWMPRKAGDKLGVHPVFIDALALPTPEALADYLVWLQKTGKVDAYRPWLQAGLPGDNASGAVADQWPCQDADVVRCGMVRKQLALAQGDDLTRALHRAIDGDLPAMQAQPVRTWGDGDAGIAQAIGLDEGSVRSMWAPWRARGADSTLEEFSLHTGQRLSHLDPHDLVMDLTRCKGGCLGGEVCIANDRIKAMARSKGRDHWVAWMDQQEDGICKPL